MSIELTSFERLTLPEEHPLKKQYRLEQQEARNWRTDFCRTEMLGAFCLECAAEPVPVGQTSEHIDRAA